MSVPKAAMVYGALLCILGLGGYFGSGRVSITALIPAFFGVAFLVCGILAQREVYRKHVMHAASGLALLAFIATLKGLGKLPALISGDTVARPQAVAAQSIMAVLSLIFLILCVKSFIDARRQESVE